MQAASRPPYRNGAIIIRSSAATDKGGCSRCSEPERHECTNPVAIRAHQSGSARRPARPPPSPAGVRSTKRGEPIFGNRPPGIGQQPLVVGEVVDRDQNRPQHFVRQEQVPQVAPAVAAGGAGAVGFERLAVALVLLIAQPQRARRR